MQGSGERENGFRPRNWLRMSPQEAAVRSISALGCGFDLTDEIHLSRCKCGPAGSRLIYLAGDCADDLVIPGGVVVRDVPSSVRCEKGERIRFCSDVLPFQQMAEQFNRGHSLSGKIPSGTFNAAFDFRGCWTKDAAATTSLCFDGWIIELYRVELERHHVQLLDGVKQDVPVTWDPAALARFIEKYGTHVIVGLKIGGSDVIHVKQLRGSTLLPGEVRDLVKTLADERFSEAEEKTSSESMQQRNPVLKLIKLPVMLKKNIVQIHVVRGGSDGGGQSHSEWLSTVSEAPALVSMSLVPITSLLNGVGGSGFLSHAINLYLRYKPPVTELRPFLEFQLPRKWAPAFNELPLAIQRKGEGFPSLKLERLGPKISVNTIPVESNECPVTGMRLSLEGKKRDRLAINLQHLAGLPGFLRLAGDGFESAVELCNRPAPVRWTLHSHVCTAPVEYSPSRLDELSYMVTEARLEVKDQGPRRVLFLRLGFSALASAKIRNSQWGPPPGGAPKAPGHVADELNGDLPGKELNSAVFPGGPPAPTASRLSAVIDTTEMVRGPEEPPGYWIVTGAKLCVDHGRISLRVKYSLLSPVTE